ncbi:MAG: ATP-binding cassette domain-containing protein [Lachnospiraceae bacterium]|nr:ATP-binding cassette domain-containing protein [Lachnospiraceae bacterium]
MKKSIRILPGTDKCGHRENYEYIDLKMGELYTIVGNTGSGKSRLIKDLEQLVNKDSVSGRTILIDGKIPTLESRLSISRRLIAHLGQNMRFVLDKTVSEFLLLHGNCRGIEDPDIGAIIDTANEITPEHIRGDMNLNTLSGGQSRALMIADIACICNSPVVLIDEIENAGIDKIKALRLLLDSNKLVLIVTHDIHTSLMSKKRIIMENGAVSAVIDRSPEEAALYERLDSEYSERFRLQTLLRQGEYLI